MHRRFRIGLSKILRRFRIGPPKIHKQFRIDPSQVSLDLLPPELHRRGILLTIAIMKELVLFGSVGGICWDLSCGGGKVGEQCGLFLYGTC